MSNHTHVDMMRLSSLVALLMNSDIARKINSVPPNIKFTTFVKTNRALLDTFNQHYYGLLPHFITALSLLMDMGCVTLVDNLVCNDKPDLFNDLREKSESERLSDMCHAADAIYNMTTGINTKTLINLLKIEL